MLIKNIHPNQLCSKLIDNAKRQKLALSPCRRLDLGETWDEIWLNYFYFRFYMPGKLIGLCLLM